MIGNKDRPNIPHMHSLKIVTLQSIQSLVFVINLDNTNIVLKVTNSFVSNISSG